MTTDWRSPKLRELEPTRLVLEQWLQATEDDEQITIVGITRPEGAGASGEIFLLDVERAGRAGLPLVVRTEPTMFKTIHRASIDRQFRVLEALASTAVPSPKPIGLERSPDVLGVAFMVIERLPGETASDFPIYNESGWLFDADVATRRMIWESAVDTLAEIHSVDASPFEFLLPGDHVSPGHPAALEFVTSALHWATNGAPPDDLAELLAWAVDNAPSASHPGLSWGDARIGNMLFVDGRCTGALDWEGALLGGPLTDLGWWLLFDRLHSEDYGVPRLDGLGDHDTTVARWQERTGLSATDLPWFEILAGIRLAIARLRAITLRSELGLWVPGDEDPRSVVRLVDRLRRMIAAR
jgi:aminoglycoside phosphotransferase (APT) family kinase protein